MDYNLDYMLRMMTFQQMELNRVERNGWLWHTLDQCKSKRHSVK